MKSFSAEYSDRTYRKTMSKITTHVLDLASGRPAQGISVVLEAQDDSGSWRGIGGGTTNSDGRCGDLLEPGTEISPGNYRLRFDTAGYHAREQVEGFYPEVVVTFAVRDPEEHYHVPVLLSPFGYSTYRGS